MKALATWDHGLSANDAARRVLQAGGSAADACEALVLRMIDRVPGSGDCQVGVLAMDFSGRVGAFSVQRGFTCALAERGENAMHAAPATLAIDGSIQVAMRLHDQSGT